MQSAPVIAGFFSYDYGLNIIEIAKHHLLSSDQIVWAYAKVGLWQVESITYSFAYNFYKSPLDLLVDNFVIMCVCINDIC